MTDPESSRGQNVTAAFQTIASGLAFPEGPIFMPDGSVIIVELAGGIVSRLDHKGTKSIIARPGGSPNGAAMGPGGFLYICNSGGFHWETIDGILVPPRAADDYSGGRIERIDLASGQTEVLYSQFNGVPLKGPNDLVFDKTGGFYFTEHGKRRQRDSDIGALYYAKADGSMICEVMFPCDNPNGIGLSPDEKTLYAAETRTGKLWAYDIAEPGVIAPIAPHGGRYLKGPHRYTSYDSLAVERDGNICVTNLYDSGIAVIAPDGTMVDFVDLPDPIPTNICFGGPDLMTAFITLSGTGRLISMPWPRPGLRLNFDPSVA